MLNSLVESLSVIVGQTKANFRYLIDILGILWGVFFLNALCQYRLLYLGIIPRKIYGLPGIICAPFLHANLNHLFFNSIPLVVLSNFLLIQGFTYFLIVTAAIILMSGILIWGFAKPGLHVGASAVITGYWGFLVSNVYQEGTVTAILLGIVCVYYFAGIFLSIFPRERGISWEGHLFGLVAGLITSYTLHFAL